MKGMGAVRASFERAKERKLGERFYQLLLGLDAEIRARFQRTNFEQQSELLIHGVYSMLDYAEGQPLGKLAIDRLSVRHGPQGLDVNARMYEHWITCFMEALSETDPEFTDELAAEWLQALRPAIKRMADYHRAHSALEPVKRKRV